MNQEHPVLLFDGVCNLCNNVIQFVIKHDKQRLIRYASLQSKIGIEIQKRFGHDVGNLDTVVLVVNNTILTESTAILNIMLLFGMPWKLLYILIIIPKPIRDIMYRVVAKNRYRWFGKKDSCMIPTPELRSLFLE